MIETGAVLGYDAGMALDQSYIYGLYDATGALRYIGKANDPQKRLKGHMRDSAIKSTPLYSWIRKHGTPEIRILEHANDWREAERRLISEARARGERLLNVADGGDQPHCSKAVRASNGRANARSVHGDARRKRIWQIKHALGVALKHGFVSEKTKDNMRMLAYFYPAEYGKWANV